MEKQNAIKLFAACHFLNAYREKILFLLGIYFYKQKRFILSKHVQDSTFSLPYYSDVPDKVKMAVCKKRGLKFMQFQSAKEQQSSEIRKPILRMTFV